jgi:hypothetical protein
MHQVWLPFQHSIMGNISASQSSFKSSSTSPTMPKRRLRGSEAADTNKDGAAAQQQAVQENGSRKRVRSDKDDRKEKRRKGAKTPSSTHKHFAKLHRKGRQGVPSVQDLPDNVLVLIFRQLGLQRLRAVQGAATPLDT